MPERAGPADGGETLLELLISVVLMGVAVVVLLGGVGTSIRISDIHRKQAVAGSYLRAFAEAVEKAVAASPSAYLECADIDTYDGIFDDGDPNYDDDVTHVRYWDGTTFDTACTAATDLGVQQVSLEVRSSDDDAVERLDVIIRKPCRPASDFPADPACA